MRFKTWLGMAIVSALGAVVACSSSSNNNGGGGNNDGGTPLPRFDASGGGGGDASTCAPADESAYAPKWHPARDPTHSCTTQQLDSYFQCEKDAESSPSGTLPASCQPWVGTPSPANLTCAQCIESKDTDAKWGALIGHSDKTVNINLAGCIAIAEGKPDGSGCGGQVQAAYDCEQQACRANCPVDASGNGLTALNDCVDNAGTGTCSKYQDPANTCLDTPDGAASQCLGPNASDFWGSAEVVAAVFCGGATPTPDGGTSDSGGAGDAAGD